MQYVDYFSSEWIDFYNVIGTLGSHVISHVAVPCFPMFSGFYISISLKFGIRVLIITRLKNE